MIEGHINCCQKILLEFETEKFGEREAYNLGSAFGGGMGMGEVCGVITGALMVIGMNSQNPLEAKAISKKFVDEFKSKFGNITCKTLKGSDNPIPCSVLIEEGKIILHRILEK